MNMITSPEFTDNSLDENISDLSIPTVDQYEKFSIFNTSSLTTPPPESVNSPDAPSYTTYDINENLTNQNVTPVSSIIPSKSVKRKLSTKRPKNFFLLNQKFIYTHTKFRENLENSYKRLKTINEKYYNNQSIKNKCNCNDTLNETCTFCKILNLSPILSKIPSDNFELNKLESYFEQTNGANCIDMSLSETDLIDTSPLDIDKHEIEDENLKKLSDNELIDRDIFKFIELTRIDNPGTKEIIEPYFYSNEGFFEGISLNQVEFDKIRELDLEFKPKKLNHLKPSEHVSSKRTNRRLTYLSESVNLIETKRFRTKSARSTSSSSTRSSVNEVCTASINHDKFDINNIFIPNDVISCQKITPFKPYKITTPKWRELSIERIEGVQNDEILDDLVFYNRHEIIELKEKLNLTNKKGVNRIESIETVDELKSILIKIDPKLVDDNERVPYTSSNLEWPERKFPLSDNKYQAMLRMDDLQLS